MVTEIILNEVISERYTNLEYLQLFRINHSALMVCLLNWGQTNHIIINWYTARNTSPTVVYINPVNKW